MKSILQSQTSLVALIAAMCLLPGAVSALAQEEHMDDTNATAESPLVTTASSTNQSASSEIISNKASQKRGQRHAAVIAFGKDVELNADQSAEAVVVIGGSATVRGKVSDAVVAVGGDVRVEGAEVGDAVVAVLGKVSVGDGSKIHGDVVSIGDGASVAETAAVDGQIQSVDFGEFNLPKLDWLKNWLGHCVIKLRPLSFRVGWVWMVAGAFLLFYVLLALALPRAVGACALELTNRPATTFLIGLLTKILVPILLAILLATGVGVFAMPFVFAALLFGALIGKTAFLIYVGQSLGRGLGAGMLTKPLVALLIGSLLLALLYLVPILGLVAMTVSGLWGLGAVILALFGGARREAPPRPPVLPGPMMPAAATTPNATMSAFAPPIAPPPSSASGEPAQPSEPPETSVPPSQPSVATPEALAFPHAGFWERMGAGFLDVVLVMMLSAILDHLRTGRAAGPGLFLLLAVVYFVAMWAWRGTTVGGIVLNLKVARMDGGQITIVVALVRALMGAFSVVMLFLGLLWIAFDPNKQGWHDKIAGTVVVRLPRGTPLVCV